MMVKIFQSANNCIVFIFTTFENLRKLILIKCIFVYIYRNAIYWSVVGIKELVFIFSKNTY